jgi:ABC-type oligopeptide transport system ATPase subunit
MFGYYISNIFLQYMEAIIIEVSVSASVSALRTYMDHRQRIIEEGKEDELISSRVKKFVHEQYSKMSSRDTTPSSHDVLLPTTTTTEEAEANSPTLTKKNGSLFSHYLRNITPNRTKKAPTIHPEFHEFVRKLLVFVNNESLCQSEPNSHLLKHQHYRALLLQSLMEEDNAK